MKVGVKVWARYGEDRMASAKPNFSRLSELAGGLGLHEHVCLIYETQEERFAAALPYLRAGLERRERCLYVTDENGAAPVLGALRREGTDVDRYVRSRALIVAGKQQTHPGHERFDPDSWIRFLAQTTHEARDDKFSGLRILGEMTWAVGAETAPQSLIEFEAKFNQLAHDEDVSGLCQYNRHRFSSELILGVIRTHPVVAYGGLVSKNPYYVPPEELLEPNQPSLEVERLLGNILAWQHSIAQLRALAGRLQTVRETERKHLARELHDEIGQLLTGLRLLLRPDGDPSSDALKSRSEQARAIVDDLLRRVRELSFDLRPADLDDLGLLPALLVLFERYTAQTGISVNFKHHGVDLRFSSEVETGAYRVVQEALTNAARHAGVTETIVRVWTDAAVMNLQVEDRGRGFDPEAVLKTPHSSGLVGMQERIMLLGGHMAIESSPGAGTTITAELPLDKTTAT
jgi:signal transduction histidine kinase